MKIRRRDFLRGSLATGAVGALGQAAVGAETAGWQSPEARIYAVALGARPAGHKLQQGDERTPEGVYSIDARNSDSAYHLSLRISYPNEEDRRRADARGVDPGGQIMIHGMGNAVARMGPLHPHFNWTDGCVAVTDEEMDEIWKLVDIGTPIEIKP